MDGTSAQIERWQDNKVQTDQRYFYDSHAVLRMTISEYPHAEDQDRHGGGNAGGHGGGVDEDTRNCTGDPHQNAKGKRDVIETVSYLRLGTKELSEQ